MLDKKNRRQRNISFGGDIDHQVMFESQNVSAEKKRVKSMHKREVSMGDVMPDVSEGQQEAIME